MSEFGGEARNLVATGAGGHLGVAERVLSLDGKVDTRIASTPAHPHAEQPFTIGEHVTIDLLSPVDHMLDRRVCE